MEKSLKLYIFVEYHGKSFQYSEKFKMHCLMLENLKQYFAGHLILAFIEINLLQISSLKMNCVIKKARKSHGS